MLHTILGSTGNIGTQLAKDLKKFTTDIRLVSRNPRKVMGNETLMKADLLKEKEVHHAVAGSETVFLVAGIPYKTSIWQEQWPIIVQNTIKACKNHRAKLVFFDNMYCYDPGHVGHLTEESPVNPQSQKGKVRANVAKMIMDQVESGKLQAMIVRAADFYGPDAKQSILNESLIARMKAGKAGQWLYSKDKKHSFTYIPDAAMATAFLAQQGDAWNQVWHLPTSDRFPSAQECANILAKELGMSPKVRTLPPTIVNLISVFVPLLKEIKELRYQLDRDYCFSSGKIEKTYGLKPTKLETGLKSCL